MTQEVGTQTAKPINPPKPNQFKRVGLVSLNKIKLILNTKIIVQIIYIENYFKRSINKFIKFYNSNQFYNSNIMTSLHESIVSYTHIYIYYLHTDLISYECSSYTLKMERKVLVNEQP